MRVIEDPGYGLAEKAVHPATQIQQEKGCDAVFPAGRSLFSPGQVACLSLYSGPGRSSVSDRPIGYRDHE